jgi:uncharacterized protein with PIN domain
MRAVWSVRRLLCPDGQNPVNCRREEYNTDVSTTYFLFHGRLNDFLRRDQKDRQISVQFRGRQSVKHLAESLGVPHPEIGRVQVNGRDEALGWITQDGDRVEVHPIEDGCPTEPRFLLDCHLGRLTAHLRMLGFDCMYQNDYDDSSMTAIAHGEARILLTRDRRLLMRKVIQHGYCLRSLDPLEQLTEVIQRFELTDKIRPFHRCLRCNQPLESVEKETILDRLEPLTKLYFDEFHICSSCGQIYWKGSHYERMQKLIGQIGERRGFESP